MYISLQGVNKHVHLPARVNEMYVYYNVQCSWKFKLQLTLRDMLVPVHGGVVQTADVPRIIGGREVFRSEVGVGEGRDHVGTSRSLEGGEVGGGRRLSLAVTL